jgi:hypothetical protein
MEVISGIFRVSTLTRGENLRVMLVRHSFSMHGRSTSCRQAWETMKVTTVRRNMDCLLFSGAKTTASVWFNCQLKASRLGEWTKHRLLLGQEILACRPVPFLPAFPLPLLASEIWSQQASLAILHDSSLAPFPQVWGNT